MTSREETKTAKAMMRRIHEHIQHAHHQLGTEVQSVSFTEVMYHPTSDHPSLNYVTPRRNMAWISGQHIQQGIDVLQEFDQNARVYFIEDLYPPMFGDQLAQLPLMEQWKIPVMIRELNAETVAPRYHNQGVYQQGTHDDVTLWWETWAQLYGRDYPKTMIEEDLTALKEHRLLNLIQEREDKIVGVARLTLYEKSAHLVDWKLHDDATDLLHNLLTQCLSIAHEHACDCFFALVNHEQTRTILDSLDFTTLSHVVCYAETEPTLNETVDESLVQPLFA